MNNDRRVVITGLGAITPLGNDVETFWRNLKNGISGIHKIEAFDTAAYDCKIGGEVRGFDPKAFFKNPKDIRRTDRFAQLGLAAAKMALEDSGIDLEKLRRRDRFGVIVSSGIGGLIHLVSGFPVSLPWWSFAIGLGFSASVGIFFGMYPAVKASRLDPIEALRYE